MRSAPPERECLSDGWYSVIRANSVTAADPLRPPRVGEEAAHSGLACSTLGNAYRAGVTVTEMLEQAARTWVSAACSAVSMVRLHGVLSAIQSVTYWQQRDFRRRRLVHHLPRRRLQLLRPHRRVGQGPRLRQQHPHRNPPRLLRPGRRFIRRPQRDGHHRDGLLGPREVDLQPIAVAQLLPARQL